ncbi:MAG: hypothetical protein ACM3UZ_09605 [Acidobacteriota bacterium]
MNEVRVASPCLNGMIVVRTLSREQVGELIVSQDIRMVLRSWADAQDFVLRSIGIPARQIAVSVGRCQD